MGICASSEYTRKDAIALNLPFTSKLIHLDGTLQEFRHPVEAGHILSQNPNCFLCNSESMYINSQVPHIPANEELQLGQIYFLMPLPKSHVSLSLQDLCQLAVKAHAALVHSQRAHSLMKISKLISGNDVRLPSAPQGCFKPSDGLTISVEPGGILRHVEATKQRSSKLK